MSEYNKQMTVGQLRELIKDIPEHAIVSVMNEKNQNTSNIEFYYENGDSRCFIELIGHKPFYAMTDEEVKLCEEVK